MKYDVVLHDILARAVRDRVIAHNPAADTDLPKVISKRQRIITPGESERLLAQIPDRYRVQVLTAIETGMRWGELAALRPRHLGLAGRRIWIEETIVEVSKSLVASGGHRADPALLDRTPSRQPNLPSDQMSMVNEPAKVVGL